MTPRVFLDKQTTAYYLVYLDEQGKSFATTRNGNVSPRCRQLVAEFKHMEHGLWDASDDMGNNEAEVRKNIRRAITQRQRERSEKAEEFRKQLHASYEERERKEQEALAQRKALAGTTESMLVKPYDIMQSVEDAERTLEPLKPGAYYVCINYKKHGYVELKHKVIQREHIKLLASIEREDATTKASLHRFAVAVRKAYESGAELIGRTHAIERFGQRMVDSIPHVMERKNKYYSSGAPRRFYDRQTLLYLKVEDAEKHFDK